MSGWCPSFSVCGMAVVCAAAVLPSAVAWARALLIPLQCWRVLLSCHATVRCQVLRCGMGMCVSVVFVWWGILYPLPPHSGGGWGRCGWWGAVVDGGWHGEGRAAVLLTPRRMSVSPVCVLVSPSRLPCGPVEWRGVVCAVVSRLCVGSASCIVLLPLVLSCPPYRIVLPLSYRRCFFFCLVCWWWGSAVVCAACNSVCGGVCYEWRGV